MLIIALAVMLASVATASAQKKPHEKPEKPEKPEKTKIKVVEAVEIVEQFVPVTPNVVITLCMDSGQITVRGSDRREVRARIPKGTEIDFHGAADATPTSPASRLEMMVAEPAGEDEAGPQYGQCRGAADIELDVPRDATL
ncbi:MAG: hypothetical protein ICV68_05015, partial [Pyrinomonadaceae bacterium]|nr:hypothetical protein [Pyrinomonadaceae bacterium]